MGLGIEFEDDRPHLDAPPRLRGGNEVKWLWATAVAALLGVAFSLVSTKDFISHLDRQVHSIHCSFIPGAGTSLGESGCRTVMMSPYSSLFRDLMWGGLPISLLAVAVFAYLVYRPVSFALHRAPSRRHTGFLVLAACLPVLMSVIYGYISTSVIGTVCKLCAGVYVSSGLILIFAILAHRNAQGDRSHHGKGRDYGVWFVEGVIFVATLVIIYLAAAPKSDKHLEGCGALVQAEDPSKIMLPLSSNTRGTPAIAILDPLCPACRAFDERLQASGLAKKLKLQTVLFPLDSKCNWMLKESLHPGACSVSEAMLCDPANAEAVLAWAFENQAELRNTAAKSERALRTLIKKKFPSTKRCIGTARSRNRLNKSLRWAVKNAIPVLTPQLFIGDRRLCDEDTDLGLEYTINQMLKRAGTKPRRASR